ncbi:hypothetical protein INR49_019769 [Caranx melampygus]|nr:hypothetical protein INR49_019769 [Caranx melampygus]
MIPRPFALFPRRPLPVSNREEQRRPHQQAQVVRVRLQVVSVCADSGEISEQRSTEATQRFSKRRHPGETGLQDVRGQTWTTDRQRSQEVTEDGSSQHSVLEVQGVDVEDTEI